MDSQEKVGEFYFKNGKQSMFLKQVLIKFIYTFKVPGFNVAYNDKYYDW